MFDVIIINYMTRMIQIVDVSVKIVITARGKGEHMHVMPSMTDYSVFSPAYKRHVGPASFHVFEVGMGRL